MKYLKTLLLLISTLLFLSCNSLTTTLETDESDFFADQMTVSSVITEGNNSLSFHVGMNRGFLDSGDFDEFNLPDASIIIRNETSGEILDFADGEFNHSSPEENYELPVIDENFFQTGDYTFTISHPDFPTSETTLPFPNKGILENIEFEFEGGIDVDGESISDISFDVIDEPGVNFYELQIVIDQARVNLETFDPSGSKGFNSRNILFRDDSFDGQTKRIEVNFRSFFWDPIESPEILIRWFNVNEGYFLQSKAVARQEASVDNPFSSAVQINSNVNDAIGVISLRSLEEYILTP